MKTRTLKHRRCLGLAAPFALLGFCALSAQAQYQVLYSFKGGPSDGAEPTGSLTLSGSTLYGFTSSGGSNYFFGTIFQYNLLSGKEGVLYDFQTGNSDGQNPKGSPLITGGLVYGLTGNGGSAGGGGTIFQYNLANNTENLLHSFPNAYSGDGSVPHGSLILSGNQLYGTTEQGGSSDLYGTVFQYNLFNNTENVLHSFGHFPDGTDPLGSLIQNGNLLYGMTSGGGGLNSSGTIFKYNLSNATESVAYSFGNVSGDGNSPFGSLVQSGNNLFGMTFAGGTDGDGTIFQYNTSSGGESILHSFSGGTSDGAEPEGDLILVGNTLYGMAMHGGTGAESGAGSNITGDGVIFAYNLGTGVYSVLHSFAGGLPDGYNPLGDLTLVGNTLYGETEYGGAMGDGTIFELTLHPLLGDANGDGKVDSSDLAILMGNFGQSVTDGYAGGDFNLDGVVNDDDFALYQLALANYNHSTGNQLPEPECLALTFAAGTLLIRKRNFVGLLGR